MPTQFVSDDLELLEEVLALIPDLTAVAEVAKLVRQRAGYPLKSLDDLSPLLDEDDVLRLANRKISREQVERFVPKTFFPIDTEAQLLCRTLIIFQRASIHHQLKQQQTATSEPVGDKPLTLLPSPVPYHLFSGE